MIVAAIRDWLYAAPLSFAVGAAIGFWLGARYEIRKKADAA
jgi:uncharacterized membrane protein YfcA